MPHLLPSWTVQVFKLATLWLLVVTKVNRVSAVTLVKLAAMSNVMSDSFSNALRTQDIQPPQTPSVHTDRPMPDLELLPQKWIEWFESDSEQPATSAALTVQQPQCTNKTVNRDTVRCSQSQFSFYSCNVTLTNVNN